ncbi:MULTISPECIES: tape measure protein [unclassified Acinetobacter]|uniref:tape measure protein n=1 Tax=unclassified Acinetobacter TaxID=196816 RepID=UPI0015D3DA7A|nr:MULTISPECIES: tape measure protein [unclassified Acinetobacter]UUS61831.1 tape measure protein [Acinetobacter sp. YH16056_T]
MSGKNLTFKLILDGDSKGLVSAAKQSEDVTKRLFDSIKSESKKIKQASEAASSQVGNIIPKGTTELADKLTQSLTAATGIIQDAGDNAKSTAGNFSDFGNKAEKALGQLKSDLTEAKRNLEAFSKTNASPADIEVAQRQVDQLEKEVQQADQAFNNFHAEVGRANNNLKETDNAAQTAQKGIAGLKTGYTALVGAMAAIGVGLGIRELAETADAYTNLSARINIATSEGGNFQQAMAGVHQVALATNTSLDSTAGLFTKVNDVGKQMGMTQQQSLDLVKTINMAIQTGGGSAQASEAAIVQLTQALQSGVLRGDEFNSIMEQAPGISTALAKSLGVTTGELRAMAGEGQLSAEKVIKALQDQSAAIEADYAKFPTTIGNALQRISTQWQILIGTMDQANGASATVAQWLVTLADNMGVVETILNDVGTGFVWMGDQLSFIDVSIFESLKSALTSAYDAIKDVVSTLFDLGKTLVDILGTSITNALAVLSSFTGGATAAGEQVSFLERVLQGLSITFGFIADGAAAIKIGVNLLAGAFFDLASAANSVLAAVTWGDVSKQFAANADVMKNKAKQYYAEADKDAMAFESKGLKRMEEAAQTQDEKNAETLSKNKETFAELTKQNEDFAQKSKSLADERAAIDAQLNQARKDGNQSTIDSILQKSNELEAREKEHATAKAKLDSDLLASAQATAEAAIAANGGVMDGVMQADLLTKGYIVTIDEAGKVSVQAGESAAQAAENARVKEEALKLAKENVKKADEELLAYQKQAAAERVLLDKQIEEAKKTGDLNALASAQASIDAINAKEIELKNNRDIRIAELNNALTGSGQVAESAYSRASAAAKLFGVDLDVSLNNVSKSFSSSGNELEEFRNRLSEAGITGKQAGDVTYQAWLKWLETAKSQAEIDAANAKMREFEAQGVFSTKQVELGIIAIKRANSELSDDLDETGKAFERLGIKTKEQLKLAAQLALADFELVRKSGQATQEDLQKAYEETIRLAYASGDAQAIAAANSKAASLGLKIQVDETGKASVVSMSNLEQTMHKVKNATSVAEDGFRNLGQTGRDEADSVKSAWEEAVSAASSGMHETRKGTKGKMAKNAGDIEAELKAMGYSDAAAKQHAKDIYEGTKGVNGYKSSGFGFFGGLSNVEQVNRELERMQQYAPNNVSTKAMSGAAKSEPQTTIRIEANGKSVDVQTDASNKDALSEILATLGKVSKAS